MYELNPLECALNEAQAYRNQVDALSAENAKLVVKLNTEHIVRQNVEIDNAKLMEFLQDLADHIKSDDGFGIDCGWVLDRMRELGVTA